MHRGLITLVGVMSLLIVIGLCLLAYGLATQTSRKGPPAEAHIILPKNGNVRHMTGYDGGIALYVSEGRQEYIYLVDPESGKQQGRITVTKEAR